MMPNMSEDRPLVELAGEFLAGTLADDVLHRFEALVLEWVGLRLAAVGEISLLIMGAILVIAMLITPEGVITTLARVSERGRTFVRAPWRGIGKHGSHSAKSLSARARSGRYDL